MSHPNACDVAVRDAVDYSTIPRSRFDPEPIVGAVQEDVFICDIVNPTGNSRSDGDSPPSVVLTCDVNPPECHVPGWPAVKSRGLPVGAPHIDGVLVGPEVAVLDQAVLHGRYDDAVAVANMRGHIVNVQIVNQREVQRIIA
jgi:hypothetical protein